MFNISPKMTFERTSPAMNRYRFNHDFVRPFMPAVVIKEGQIWQSINRELYGHWSIIHILTVNFDEVRVSRVEGSSQYTEWMKFDFIRKHFMYLDPVERTDVF